MVVYEARPGPDAAPRVAASEDVFRLIVENAADLIVRADARRHRSYVSPAARELLGYAPAELLAGHGLELVHPEEAAMVAAGLATLGADKPQLDVTFRMRRKDGDYVWVAGRYCHLAADGGVLAVLRDITAQKRAEERLARALAELEAANRKLMGMAYIDGLTGLFNRRRFDELLLEVFQRALPLDPPLGLLLLDIDYFKGFNDLYGHLGGDDCLRRVSRTVADSLWRMEDCAARFGGEELAVLLPATDLDGAMHIAAQIRMAVEQLGIVHAASPLGIVTVSIGVLATCPATPGVTPEDLLAGADTALYRAKKAGRNTVCGPASALTPAAVSMPS